MCPKSHSFFAPCKAHPNRRVRDATLGSHLPRPFGYPFYEGEARIVLVAP